MSCIECDDFSTRLAEHVLEMCRELQIRYPHHVRSVSSHVRSNRPGQNRTVFFSSKKDHFLS
jgi:hypothetical protein